MIKKSTKYSAALGVALGIAMTISAPASWAVPKPTKQQIKNFVSALSAATTNACPAAYTQFPNVPTREFQGLSKLRTSKLIASVPAAAIQQNQTLKAQPYSNLTLPDGSQLGGYTPANQDAEIYQIHYASTNVSGEPTLLSGLVVLPVSDLNGGIIIYDHATQVSQISGAPSTPSVEACTMVTALGGKNRILAMPDYLGFGINNDIHPYPLGPYNAAASIDMITAARELAQQLRAGQPVGRQLYVTGYSEGGGNALWLGRILEEPGHEDMQPTLMAPMSGNYDMTGAMAQSLIVMQPVNVVTLISKPLLLSFTAQAGWEITGVPPNSLIQDKLATYDQINPLPIPYAGEAESAAYVTGLTSTAFGLGYLKSSLNPLVLMQSALVNDIKTTNLANPVIELWNQANNLDWRPKAPIYATGILQDQIVPFAGSNYPVPKGMGGGLPYFAEGNSQNLVKSMRSRGIDANRVLWCAIGAEKVTMPNNTTQTINHLNGLVPVSILAAKAIEQGSLAGLPRLADP